MTADVSVIVPAWRAEATLARAVESALMQEGVGVEVIVVDDASPDGTFAEAERLATDSRVIALKQDVNQGPSAARNRALEVATGTYVTPLDSDDFMEPHRLARLVEIARAEDLDAVADDLLTVSEDDIDGPRTRHFSQSEIGLRTIDLPAFITGNLVAHHGGRGEMGYVKPLIRNAFLDKHGIRYDEDMRL
ncbi:MAG: glycosyltransferase family 2 protein, partial [Pseudomonadota bacterium]